MTRQPFAKRPFVLRSEAVRDSLIAVIRNLPIDESKPLQVVVSEETKQRGLDANAYYWVRAGEIADQAWLEGRQYSAEIWHEYFRRNVMADEITLKDGTVRSKWIELPDGSLTVVSTTQLERKCFATYVTMVEAFGASLGVRYSERPS